ncbi:hypothetical protein ABH935_006193 [Catenulispora sp. GAS73]|uniref:hypothetical protein n=1 Tax=Catenulispora sp. GAS73 TaxID=3156269 RepID=UPI00351153AE
MSSIEALRHEYDAENGTFLLRARIERVWDREAFNRLQRTMREVCEELADQDRIDRWIADAFWFAEGFVREDQSFHRPEPQEYFEDAKHRMFDLCSWLFTGQSPYLPGHVWPDL